MSFSQEVKKEILSRELPHGCCAIAAAYAVACFGKYFDAHGVVLHTESPLVAHYAQHVMARAGITGKVYPKGGKPESNITEFSVKDETQVRNMLLLFDHTGEEPALRINSVNFVCDHCVNSFVSTAFLCCGTMTDPSSEYNLEFLSSRYHLMRDFSALLMGHGFTPRHTQRKGSNVLYLKASEQIEDLLTFMGASGSALEIMNLKVYKDFRNKANRITNCETANIDKMVAANQKTIQAVEYLTRHDALVALPQSLQDTAKMRLQYPDLGLKALAEEFEDPVSKSGLAHRMKKLEQIAAQMQEREQHG